VLGYTSESKVRPLDRVYVSVTILYLVCLLNNGIPGFGCPEVVFLLIEFPLRQQKSLCLLLSVVLIFVDSLHTHLSFI